MKKPFIGDVRKGREIGKTNSLASEDFIYQKCLDCGKERWVVLVSRGIPETVLCRGCSAKRTGRKFRGEKNWNWRGGRYLDERLGYVYIWLDESDPLFCIADSKTHQVAEHRYVMAQHLNRPLESLEIVHHLNGIKTDNRIENLCLTSLQDHRSEERKLIEPLQLRIRELEAKLKGEK